MLAVTASSKTGYAGPHANYLRLPSRPVIFRSTSYGAASSLVSSAVKHPHGNTLTSDAFSAGMIRSATDYQVYARGVKGKIDGMQGLDFAFYKNRAYYHTPRDSIAGMGAGEGRKALWAMMETTLGSGLSMLNRDEFNNDARASVYFDRKPTLSIVDARVH